MFIVLITDEEIEVNIPLTSYIQKMGEIGFTDVGNHYAVFFSLPFHSKNCDFFFFLVRILENVRNRSQLIMLFINYAALVLRTFWPCFIMPSPKAQRVGALHGQALLQWGRTQSKCSLSFIFILGVHIGLN